MDSPHASFSGDSETKNNAVAFHLFLHSCTPDEAFCGHHGTKSGTVKKKKINKNRGVEADRVWLARVNVVRSHGCESKACGMDKYRASCFYALVHSLPYPCTYSAPFFTA